MERKIAFITGAASGIGLAIAKTLATNGAIVYLSDLNEHELAECIQALRADGLRVSGIPCDVTDEKRLKAVIDEVVNRSGRLDVLVNNAGLQHISPIEY